MPTTGRCVAVLCVVLCGCAPTPKTPDYQPQIGATQPPRPSQPEYSFGVLPTHNAIRLFETYQPLIEEIDSRISGFKVKLETAKDYPEYEAKVRDRRLNFVMLNSHLVIPPEGRGYQVISRTADRIRGAIRGRKSASFHDPRDLKTFSISF